MTYTNQCQGGPWFSGIGQLLPKIHPQLWNHLPFSHSTAEEGGDLPLVIL